MNAGLLLAAAAVVASCDGTPAGVLHAIWLLQRRRIERQFEEPPVE